MDKISQIKTSDEDHGFKPLLESETSHGRLDLNNLLNRIKEQKRKSKKINLFIFSATATAVVVFLALLSI